MLARLTAFVIWALVAAAVVFWGLRLLVRPPSAPAYAVAVADVGVSSGDLTRLFGAAPAPAAGPVAATPEASSRFRLLGIAAPKSPGTGSGTHGVALIAVDGKMPKAYAVGARLDGDLVLRSVSLRTVSIAPPSGAPAITLEMPPPAAAATGRLPAPGAGLGEPPASVATPVPQVQQAIAPPGLAPGMLPNGGEMPTPVAPVQLPARAPVSASPR
jgi:general secretion pathway protein C